MLANNKIVEIENAINENNEVVLQKSGNNIIVMSMEEFRNNCLDENTINHLIKSEDDIKNGRTRDGREVVKELREKYGF